MSHMLLGHLGCLGVNDWFGLCLPGSRPGSGQAVHMQCIEMNQKCFPLQGTVACGGRTGREVPAARFRMWEEGGLSRQCLLEGSLEGDLLPVCVQAPSWLQPQHPAEGSGKIRVRLCPIS